MKTQKTRRAILVVGAGPSGFMAAIAAARAGAAVTLCEQLEQPGRKLLASGGGHCNLTNVLPPEDFIGHFGRTGRFMSDALRLLDHTALRGFFAELGVPTVVTDGFHVFPESGLAQDVLVALNRECGRLGVRQRLRCRVESLRVQDGAMSGVDLGGEFLEADAVILCTGGCSYPALGGTGGGYRLAEQIGHKLEPRMPALAPLVTRERWPHACAGNTLQKARLTIDLPRQRRDGVTGELMFTHTGISGPAALDLSGAVAELLRQTPDVPVILQVDADRTEADWQALIADWRRSHGRRQVRNQLATQLPTTLARELCAEAGVPEEGLCAELGKAPAAALARLLAGAVLTISATGGFDVAMVTRGGVSLKEVDPHTLASRRVQGLHFAGELLDLDGPCGGYNLQWAFASGWLAGQCAAVG